MTAGRISAGILCALVAMLACGAASASAIFGANEDAPKYAEDGGQAFFADLSDVGLTENVMSVLWDPDNPAAIAGRARIAAAVAAAQMRGIRVTLAVYPAKAKGVTGSADGPARFVDFVAQVARAFPSVKRIIVGNEPNQPRFWQPQFDADGTNASAAAFEAVLEGAYDALKEASPDITVIGVGLSPRGNDDPKALSNVSTSPVRFLRYLGAAYRASGRTKPLMDELSFHPYPNVNTDPPDKGYAWPNAGLPNLDRIKQAFYDAFHGTGQPTFEDGLRMKLDETGWQVDTSGESGYTGSENVPTIDEATQAAYYRQIVDAVVCDPSVESLNFFHFLDESDRNRFQSGLERADGSRRASYEAVKQEIARTGGDCQGTPQSWHHATGVDGAKAVFRGRSFTGTANEDVSFLPGIFLVSGPTLSAADTEALEAALTAAKARPAGRGARSGPVTVLIGKPITIKGHRGGTFQVDQRGLKTPGYYVYALLMSATSNPERTTLLADKPFQVSKPKGAGPSLRVASGAAELVAPLALAVRKARTGLTAIPRLRGPARVVDRQLAAGQDAVELGARNIASGKVCEGARAVTGGTGKLRRSGARLGGVVADLRQALQRENRRPGGDAEERDFLWHELGYRRGLVAQVERDARDLEQTFTKLCAAVRGRKTVRGTILRVDDAEHTLRLDGGTVVTLADVPYHSAFTEGSLVAVTGLGLKDGTVYGTRVDVIVKATKPPKPSTLKCVFFRIAPAQSFEGPVYDSPPPGLTLHTPQGYLIGGKLWLEAAMRLGVERKNCPKIPLSGSGLRYSMEIELTYEDTVKKKQVTSVVAEDLDGTEAPVELPPTIDSDTDAKLVATTRLQTCQVAFKSKIVNGKKVKLKYLKCGPAEIVDTETYTARVRGGSYFTLKYDGVAMDGQVVLLALNDHDFSTFQTVKLGGLAPGLSQLLLAGTSYEPEARGFLVTGNSSSKPNVKTIKTGDSFAAYARPWERGSRYPITGLWNGRVKGTRNGKPFWYTAAQPWVISDIVSFCSGEASYRLPWQPGLTVAVGQGNNTTFTHQGVQKYAFDFSLADGQTIYAPRGGVVTFVEESLSKTSDPHKVEAGEEQWAPANALRIEHQDGTASWYYHMQHNGVIPPLYAWVHRGSPVAITGNTGNSTGPHLHYQAQGDPTEWEPTIQIRFQTNAGDCVIPATDGEYVSNNS